MAANLSLASVDSACKEVPSQLDRATENMEQCICILESTKHLGLIDPAKLKAEPLVKSVRQVNALRAEVGGRVGAFHRALLPASADMVNSLKGFLDKLQNKEEFIALVDDGLLSKRCRRYAAAAGVVRVGFEHLAADLAILHDKIEVQLQQANLDVKKLEATLDAARTKAEAMQDSSLLFVGLGLAVGAALAAALLGPGGLLFAPMLAGHAWTACTAAGVAVGATAYNAGDKKLTKLDAQRGAFHTIDQNLNQASRRLPEAARVFGAAMTVLAQFFSELQAAIKNIDENAEDMEEVKKQPYRATAFEALRRIFLRQAQEINDSCTNYQRFYSRINILMNKLHKSDPDVIPPMHEVENWLKAKGDEHPEHKKEMDALCSILGDANLKIMDAV